MEPLVNIKVVADYYTVTTKTVRNWIKAGMPCMKRGNVLRFSMKDVVEWEKVKT